MAIGIGYDIHRLAADRPLVIGGITIPFDKGLLGHSDGDPLIHALCDALLGAACLGDIGTHFPDTDPAYKDIESARLLHNVKDLIASKGWSVENVDSIIIIERPKIVPYRKQIRENLAGLLSIDIHKVNVKAKTMEGLGDIGRGEAAAAWACVSLVRTKVQNKD